MEGKVLKYKKGKSNITIKDKIYPTLEEIENSNVVVNKEKSSVKRKKKYSIADTDNRGGRHNSSRDDANRGRDA